MQNADSDPVRTTLRIPKELHDRLDRIVREEHRTLNGLVLYLVEHGLGSYECRLSSEDREGVAR